VNETSTRAESDSAYYLEHGEWCLDIAYDAPEQFSLSKNASTVFSGELKLINNSNPVSLESVVWRFRMRDNRLEQWCNIRSDTSLSISITYAFENNALCIDYLARSSIPTRLDVLHAITQVDPAYQSGLPEDETLTKLTDWQHESKTRAHLTSVPTGQREFREAFYSTQWILLEENVKLSSKTEAGEE
jgi:hypothetical protein